MLTISKNQRSFEQDGTPFFYLADTCWSAFTNIAEDEWEFYLKKRKQQGFNTLQINILPQWDACQVPGMRQPFLVDEHGNYEYSSYHEEYFHHAALMCERAASYGFTLALVVLWCNYIPDTWAYKIFKKNAFPIENIADYVKKIDETFARFHPIYIISGDTDFTDISKAYYIEAAKQVQMICKGSLVTTHIKGRYSEIPEELDELIDFYMYQSGHNALPENQGMSYRRAYEFYQEKTKKPIINSEPCYEMMGSSGGCYHRFSRFDVRKAAWQSILSGASAGITYGAAGIYSWQKDGYDADLTSEGFDRPNAWNQAMSYPGAWDYGHCKDLLESMQIQELIPYELNAKSEEIRAAMNPDNTCLLIYMPYSTSISLPLTFQEYRIRVMDLDHKWIAHVNTKVVKDKLCIDMHPFEADSLYILEK